MRPSKLWKTHTINLADEGETPATLTIRLADQEYAEKLEAIDMAPVVAAQKMVADATDADGNVSATPEMAGFAVRARGALKSMRSAWVGSYLVGWSGWEDNDGKPLPDRDEHGALHVANGVYLLGCDEVWERFEAEIKALREARTAAVETGAKNSETLSLAN